MSEKTHHVSEKKKDIAKKVQKLILDYPIIAAVDMENLPAPQLQQMRAQLRGKIELAMTKRRVIKHAIEGVKDKKKGIEQIEPHLKGMPALIFTKENPFSLFKNLKKSKTSAPAKAGQTAPFDIIVPKGPTSFMPGPVIGELAELGIKSGVEGGKVAIKEDSIAAKEGEKISPKAAEILTRLGIEPMEVGLNVTAVYENGEIFTRDILDIDEEKFKADLEKAVSGAFNLAMNIEYPTEATIKALIGKAFNDAKALGLSQEIIDEGIIESLLSKAEGSALSLKSTAKIETVEKPKEEKKKEKAEQPKVEPKAEEKKEEPQAKKEPKEEKTEPPKEIPKKEETPEPKKETPAPKAEEKTKQEPTPTEKKEEKVLEEEKEIIKEEKKLEKEVKKPEVQAPVEKEVKKEVKEIEEKQLEKERIEKEKELENIEKNKPKEKPKDTDQKIAEMVAKTKKFVKGEIPDAGKLVEEAGKLTAKETPAPKPQDTEEEKAPEKVPSIQDLQEKKQETKEEKEKKKQEQDNVADLTKELIRKGTLRK